MENRKLKLWELDRVDEETFKSQAKFPIVLILNDIRSLNNIGSFFRTGDALNVEKIYLCGITATPPHRDIHKIALGATETVEWHYEENIMDLVIKLQKEGYAICTVEQTEKTTLLHQIDKLKEEKFALVFGNEVDGVDQDIINIADHIIEIPQFGTKHSFNVAVCAGIVTWEFTKRFIK